MSGRVLLTGATGGIGREIAAALAARGEQMILGCRNAEKARELLSELPGNHEVVELDLADEKSVRAAAEALAGKELKGVIHNAGTMERRYRTDALGREITMAVNYWNTRLLTELLLPRLQKGARIVFTTSLTRYLPLRTNSLEVNELSFSQLITYALSKKALTRYAADLSAQGVGVNCADPGVVDTGMISMDRWFDPLADRLFRPFIRNARKGAEPALRAFTSPSTGLIFCRRRTHRL